MSLVWYDLHDMWVLDIKKRPNQSHKCFYLDLLSGFSMVSDSQGATEFVSSMPFSEDSNSQGSDGPAKRLKTTD